MRSCLGKTRTNNDASTASPGGAASKREGGTESGGEEPVGDSGGVKPWGVLAVVVQRGGNTERQGKGGERSAPGGKDGPLPTDKNATDTTSHN